ncbi:hypothetical protein J6590_010597 [Homalodisca vitripennis]|nr:hypothetical protein J6590_010597 [Homalodisca vitripennis]
MHVKANSVTDGSLTSVPVSENRVRPKEMFVWKLAGSSRVPEACNPSTLMSPNMDISADQSQRNRWTARDQTAKVKLDSVDVLGYRPTRLAHKPITQTRLTALLGSSRLESQQLARFSDNGWRLPEHCVRTMKGFLTKANPSWARRRVLIVNDSNFLEGKEEKVFFSYRVQFEKEKALNGKETKITEISLVYISVFSLIVEYTATVIGQCILSNGGIRCNRDQSVYPLSVEYAATVISHCTLSQWNTQQL